MSSPEGFNPEQGREQFDPETEAMFKRLAAAVDRAAAGKIDKPALKERKERAEQTARLLRAEAKRITQEQAELRERYDIRHVGIMDRIARRWRALGLAAGIAGLVGGFVEQERQQAAAERALPRTHLEEADPEATKERMQQLFVETIPRGLYEDVGQLTAVEDIKPMPEEYGMEDVFVAAELSGGDEEKEGTEKKGAMIFYGSSRDMTAREKYGELMIHELAHGSSDSTDDRLSPAMRRGLRAWVLDRVNSPDRFRSWYVESIKNKDPEERDRRKAGEYWAEIVMEYLRSERPEMRLPLADLKMVQDFIRSTDPEFDQAKARRRRLEITAEMDRDRLPKAVAKAAAKIGGSEGQGLEERFHGQSVDRTGGDESDADVQRQGRAELVRFVSEWSDTKEHQRLAHALIARDRWLQTLAALFASREPGTEMEAIDAIKVYVAAVERYRAAAAKVKKSEAASQEFQRIVSTYHLRFDVMMDEGEFGELLDAKAGVKDPVWLLEATGWAAAEEDDDLYDDEVMRWAFEADDKSGGPKK